MLDASLRTIDEKAREERDERIKALRRSITEAEAKSKRLVRTRSLEMTDDVDPEFIRNINERWAELRAECEKFKQRLADAEDEIQRAANPALLDYLPITPVDLTELPDELSRRLFEALRLEIRYDHRDRTATCRVTLLCDTIDAVSRTTQEAVLIPFRKPEGSTEKAPDEGLPSGTVCEVPPAGIEPAT